MQLNRQLRCIWLETVCIERPYFSTHFFPQIIAAFLALFYAIGLPGNLLVIVTIALERRFHVMRYILLASLALSDFLFLILVNSFRIASVAHERWLYGETMCFLNPVFPKYFYAHTVFHLLAVSYDRYVAIVNSPLTYDGTITKSKVVVIALIWVIPVATFMGAFFGGGEYVYNPEIYFCHEVWTAQSTNRWKIAIAVVFLFIMPFLATFFLNWSVYKAARVQANQVAIQIGSFAGSESQQQETSRRQMSERKAAIENVLNTSVYYTVQSRSDWFCVVEG